MLPRLNPFEYFTDTNGDPLDGGYVYIGSANQNPKTSPITVYFDSAMTIPAPQPLRTTAGRIVKSGSPAAIYSNAATFSILVENKSGQQVSYTAAAESDAAANMAALAASSGSSLVGFIQAGADTVARTVQSKLRDTVNAADYGFSTSASASANVTAINAAFSDISAGIFRVLELPEGTFQLNAGLLLPTKTFVIRGKGSGIGCAGATILQFTHTDSSDCIKFQAITDTAAVYYSGPILEGFMVLGNSSTGDGVELSIGDVADITIRDVYVRNVGGEAFNLNDAFICRFENLRGSIADNGVVMTRCNECTLSGTFDAMRDNGVVMNTGRANRFDGNIDDVGTSGAGGSGLKLQSVSDSKFHYYFESKSSTTARETARLDSMCVNNNIRYYSTDRNVYSDDGVDNVIHGVKNDGTLSNKRIQINIPNSSFDESALSNWTTNGVGATAAAIVSSDGASWVSTIFTAAAGITNLYSISDASSLVYAPSFAVGEVINVQFRVKATREIRSQYAGASSEYLQFSPTGATALTLDNYYARHYEFFSVGTTEKIVKMKFKVLTAGAFGFRIQAVNIAADTRIYVTDVVFSKNTRKLAEWTDIAGVNNGQRYAKGIIVGGSNSTASKGYINTSPGYATTTAWAATTAYVVGDKVVTAGKVLQCIVAGTSGGVAPTPSASVVDGTVTWTFLENAASFTAIP